MRPPLLAEIAGAFRPNVLTCVLLTLLAALPLFWMSEYSILEQPNGDARIFVSYGRGVLEVTRHRVDGQLGPTAVDVSWVPLVCALAVFYVTARSVASAAEYLAAGRASPLRWLAAGIALTIVAAFVVASVWSRVYWGYVFRRPLVAASIAGLEFAEVVTSVTCERQEGTYSCSPNPARSLEDEIDYCARDPYECLSGRIPSALSKAGKLPQPGRKLSPGELAALADVLRRTDRLAAEGSGYSGNAILGGVVALGLSRAGRPVLAFGLRGTQVANDHYPYYEALITLADAEPRILRFRTIFHDIAGIEGFEWRQMFGWALAVGLPAAAPFALVLSVLVGRRRARYPVRRIETRIEPT